jgi:hypothetical protein
MSKWWEKAKKQGQKTKLRGQILLAQRETIGRKKSFGVELYDLLTNDKEKLLGVSVGTLFKDQNTEELQAPFERAKDDIAVLQGRKDKKQRDLDVLEIKGHHTMPDETIGEKAKKAGQKVADASVQAKIKAQMALIDREMKIRKEKFGIEVFDLAKQSSSSSPSSSDDANANGDVGTQQQQQQLREGGASKGSAIMDSSQMSDQEKEIQDLIDKAKHDVSLIEQKQKSLERDIGVIDEEMQPLSQQHDHDDDGGHGDGSQSESY